ncbi:hypothetical protein Pint_03134 [Pistacia integerrima]|uniref:Uncharacterized protein n=1 Tax=Pistacia integerrima TaxID=434235 RepID=A0ACC0ZQI8_9ROSI|nr:hypothetical protein Pint_03134 [Pistacia integerrima]
MLQFSKRLDHKGVKVTLVTTLSMIKTIHRASSSSIALETISDGYDEGGMANAESIQAYLDRFWQVGPQTLIKLVEKMNVSGCPVDCIVYDSFLPWALDVARKFGMLGVVFLTQSCAVDSICYHAQKGLLKLPLTGLPPLQPQDMPSFIYDLESYPAFFDMVVTGQFATIDKADFVLCNTFYELEKEVVDWLAKLWPLKTIGPTIPSMYLDKRLEDDKVYGFSIFEPNSEVCMKWLNDREEGSVVYVSFGSLAALETEQMEELAWALKQSDKYFLWVVRASEEAKIPKNFPEKTSEKGLMINWCPQLEVLAHEAMGCFVTHCGWNSTLEALSLGVPMVAMPQWTDQSTNAKNIMDVCRMGLKAPADEKGIVRKEAIEHCIKEILEGERGKEIKENAGKWKKLAKEAMAKGGSSDKNIEEFVANLISFK